MTEKAHLTIVFADIAGSSRLYLGLGDERASQVVAACINAMSQAVHQAGGIVVRVIGDEVLATFPSANAAVGASVTMQHAIIDMPPVLGRRLAIRIGMHAGEVLQIGTELYGDAVNVAARMADQAKGGEILMTAATSAELRGTAKTMCRPIGWVDIKGQNDNFEITEIVWRAEEATMMSTRPGRTAPRPPEAAPMAFCMGGAPIPLTEAQSTISFGRETQNDLVVMGPKVSRQHCFVELRRGRVVLVDQSANGTFIVPDSGQPTHLHRDTIVLTGTGRLGLGEAPEENPLVVIRYTANDARS
jgi:class 3 adenylate cyclase